MTVPDGGADESFELRTAHDTHRFGLALGRLLRAGDLVVLTGELGAGKTTLTQGIAEGLQVRGPITSPTFVIAREHPSLVAGPALVHVDAYRLGGATELDDLDLDTALEDAVTVVEWGAGLAEQLSGELLEVVLERPDVAAAGSPGAEQDSRTVLVRRVGARWSGVSIGMPRVRCGEPPPI